MAKANGARLLGYDEKESEKEKEAQRKEQHGPSFLWLPGENHPSLFTGNLSGFCPGKRSQEMPQPAPPRSCFWGLGTSPTSNFAEQNAECVPLCIACHLLIPHIFPSVHTTI